MIFIDTGPFLARHLARDQHHLNATFNLALVLHASGRSAESFEVLDQSLQYQCDADLLALQAQVQQTLRAESSRPGSE